MGAPVDGHGRRLPGQGLRGHGRLGLAARSTRPRAPPRCAARSPTRTALLKPEMYATVSISVDRAQGARHPAHARSCASATRRSSSSQTGDDARRPAPLRARARRRRRGRGRASGSPVDARPRARARRSSPRAPSCSPGCSERTRAPMIQRLVALRPPDAGHRRCVLAVCAHRRRALLLQGARHRGLPEPGAAAGRGHHAAERLERRGGRALRHDPARDRPRRACPGSTTSARSRSSGSPT